MGRLFQRRLGHWLLLLLTCSALTLPNLGGPSLWDIDESLNAEAAREMYESGNYVVPKFNFQLRDAKPALLYWLQAAAYRALGVNEFAARLPSALAAVLAVLAIYELGRAMFTPSTALLAAVAMISSLLVCGSAHFANPDALLLACTSLSFLAFWLGYAPSHAGESPKRAWFVPLGLVCGLGMLAKGPVAVALPALAIALFLVWQGRLRCLWDRRLLFGACAFAAVAVPWFLMVTVETRGAFARGFFLKNNVERFLAPMEEHRGPFWYHPAALLAGFAPWSIFVLPTIWYAVKGCARRPVAELTPGKANDIAAHCLLLCWFVTYLAFFSASATKLPSYTLPLYPALALLTSRFLDGWRRGEYRPPRILMGYSLLWLAVIGIGSTAALRIAGGAWSLPGVNFRTVPGLEHSAWLGLIPLAGVAAFVLFWVVGHRGSAVACCGLTAAAFTAGIFAMLPSQLNEAKAPRRLIAAAGACRRDRDVRLASFDYMQPSMVFYGQRAVQSLATREQAAQFLRHPTPSFVVMPATSWESLQQQLPANIGQPVTRQWDIYRNCEIVMVGNVSGRSLAQRN